ncbi:dipeptidyl aminopeptidase/acylaminoacyl peptidase [Pseudoxanthomonas sp. 3HH-4]|uniref:alpha/beta hydrolase family protein n=1 Tax=Pseudoxanthomonas sp. 3HH-4 TaxID=1690214 RepID=UPI00114E689A|nr:S9 family peptidase [Pseudoxanthomonas sp. 3HH-4]TQM05694.1 dipeptidyl aminopeptidase/acylaminoacyl peptidase [Pseudoxanthomonas sp. 3HH-4]
MEWGIRSAGILLGCLLAPLAHAQVELEPFLKRDVLETLKISPTGEYYAMTVPLEDQTILAVIRRSDKQVTSKVSAGRDSVINGVWWVSDERVVVSVAKKYGSRDQPYATGELYATNADGSARRQIFARYGLEGTELQPRAAYLIDTLPGQSRKVLVGMYALDTSSPSTRVEMLDVFSGDLDTVATAPVRNARFVVDPARRVRYAIGSGDDNISKLYHRADDDSPWTLVNDEGKSGHVEWPLGLSTDGRTAYLQVQQAQGPDAIVALDTTNGGRTQVMRDPVVDPHDIIYADDGRTPVGSFFMHEKLRTAFFDEESTTARLYRKLERSFPGSSIEITSGTRDGRLKIVHAWSDTSPGDFFLFDTTNNSADLVFSRRSWLDPAKVAPSELVTLRARDGLALHGYLTRPHGHHAAPLPMVVMPHGGPFGVFDGWEFNDEAEMLARAGYTVLRLNYRGSGNYGSAFQQAGARQWGRTMQDDVTDATRWAIEQKIADPQRICLYGASYGGYAALMGVAKEPELYRCAAGYVGVYDLELMHKQKSRSARWMGTYMDDWVGDDRARLVDVSPTALASRIQVPVFLAAGGKDEIAPQAHSERMEKALKLAGVPVEALYVRTEGHGFYAEANQRTYYTRLLDFLSRHLGGAKAK